MRVLLVLSLFLTSLGLLRAETKAHIGIQITENSKTRKAKVHEEISSAATIRAMALPVNKGFVYVVRVTGDDAFLILKKTNTPDELVATLGENISGETKIVIIVSQEKRLDLESAFISKKLSKEKWEKLEVALIRIDNPDEASKPNPVAANVRAMGDEGFARGLPVFTGNVIVAKFHLVKN